MKQFEVGFVMNGIDKCVPVQADYYQINLAFGILEFFNGLDQVCAFKEWNYVMHHKESRNLSAPQEFTQQSAKSVKSKISVFSSKEP